MIATASCTVEIAGTGTISEIKDGVFMQHERGFQHDSMDKQKAMKLHGCLDVWMFRGVRFTEYCGHSFLDQGMQKRQV